MKISKKQINEQIKTTRAGFSSYYFNLDLRIDGELILFAETSSISGSCIIDDKHIRTAYTKKAFVDVIYEHVNDIY